MDTQTTQCVSASRSPSAGVSPPPVGPRSALVRELTAAYWGELETVSDYVVSSTNRDCIRTRLVAQCLRDAIACNLDHAQCLATRIKQLHGPVPGPDDFSGRELRLAGPAEPHDNISVLTAVLGAETAAIGRYARIAAAATNAGDWITQNLAARLVREKEAHRELLRGNLAELAESARA
jgi:bacterioferritin